MTVAALSVAATLVPAALARADAGSAVIRDCVNNGAITRHFSQQALSQALAEMPAAVTEYSNCADLIRQAELAGAGGRGGSGGGAGGGNVAPAASFTPGERAALTAAHRAGGAGVQIGGAIVRPGVVHVGIASAVNDLPTSLLVLLALLGAGAVLALGRLVFTRVRARSSH